VHTEVKLTGPITGARPPNGAPRLDVSDRGYVVEEFQIAGTATAYMAAGDDPPGVDGRWELEAAGIGDYVTRLLVIRPTDPARFNGTVLLNWQNVSGGAERRAPSSGELYDDGFAWVGVSAQEVGLYGFPMGMDRGRAAVAPARSITTPSATARCSILGSGIVRHLHAGRSGRGAQSTRESTRWWARRTVVASAHRSRACASLRTSTVHRW
jgi:hypothetical protein